MLVPTVSTRSPFILHQRTAQCRCRALLRRMTVTPPDLAAKQPVKPSLTKSKSKGKLPRGCVTNAIFSLGWSMVKLRGSPHVPILNHGCQRVGSCALQCASWPISMLLRWLKHLSCYILVLVYIHWKKSKGLDQVWMNNNSPLQYSPLSFWEVPPILNISFISEVTKSCYSPKSYFTKLKDLVQLMASIKDVGCEVTSNLI